LFLKHMVEWNSFTNTVLVLDYIWATGFFSTVLVSILNWTMLQLLYMETEEQKTKYVPVPVPGEWFCVLLFDWTRCRFWYNSQEKNQSSWSEDVHYSITGGKCGSSQVSVKYL
jgi:hypothetical protein